MIQANNTPLSIQALKQRSGELIQNFITQVTPNKAEAVYPALNALGDAIDTLLHDTLTRLQGDFNTHIFSQDTLDTHAAAFEHLESLLKTQKDTLRQAGPQSIVQIRKQVLDYQRDFLDPACLLFETLEQAYITMAARIVYHEQHALLHIKETLKKLGSEKEEINNTFFTLGKRKKLNQLQQEIETFELNHRITHATLEHAKLNLYYFTHDHPPELFAFKQDADHLREGLYSIHTEATP